MSDQEQLDVLDSIGRRIMEGIRDIGISPNEQDRNLEPANIVDGLYAIARSLDRLAVAIEKQESTA